MEEDEQRQQQHLQQNMRQLYSHCKQKDKAAAVTTTEILQA